MDLTQMVEYGAGNGIPLAEHVARTRAGMRGWQDRRAVARKAAVAAAMELLDAGYTIRAAAKRLGVCEDALGKWLRNDRKRELEEAYRAGREAAARDLEAQADDEAQRPGRAEPSEIIERWLREAARIAREGNSERLAAELEDDEDPLSARCTTDDEPWSPEELP